MHAFFACVGAQTCFSDVIVMTWTAGARKRSRGGEKV
jgi:hypothetical protein